VGRFWFSHTFLNTTPLTVGAAEGCDLLTLTFTIQKQDQKIAAFGSSYRGIRFIQLETGQPSGRQFPQNEDQKIAACGSSYREDKYNPYAAHAAPLQDERKLGCSS
jgi:hypothetical protein